MCEKEEEGEKFQTVGGWEEGVISTGSYRAR